MASSSQDLDSAESVADSTQPNWALRNSKAWTVVAILLLLAAAAWGLVFILEALIPFIWGGFIAFLVRPIITKFERRMSRGSAVATTFILILVVSVLLAVLLVPRLVENLQSFAADLPGKVQQAQENAAVVSDKLNLPPAVKSAITTAADGMASEFRAAMQSIVQFMLAAGGAAVGLGFDIFLGFIIAIWLMLGGSSLSKWSLSVMPPAWRDGAWEIGTSFDRSFGGFIRGSVIDMSVLFVGCAIGFYAIGLPYSTFLALIVGLLGVIPFVGSILGGLIAIVVGFTVSPTVGVLTHHRRADHGADRRLVHRADRHGQVRQAPSAGHPLLAHAWWGDCGRVRHAHSDPDRGRDVHRLPVLRAQERHARARDRASRGYRADRPLALAGLNRNALSLNRSPTTPRGVPCSWEQALWTI